LRASLLHPAAVIGAQVVVSLFSAALGTVLLIVTARWPSTRCCRQHTGFVAAFFLSCLSLYALSMFAANLFRSVNAARAAFMAVFFPMMFLSGGSLPKQFLPEVMQTISKFMPLTYAVDLIKGIYLDAHWDLTALAVLSGILLVFGVLGVRYFRWE
jgi:ABC-2 type transport system permease protein